MQPNISVNESKTILVIDDSEADVELIKLVFARAPYPISLDIVENGMQALDYVFKRGDYVDKNSPDLILLDLNIPGIDGFEVLNVIKTSDNYRQIPIIILTSSDNSVDIFRSYQLYANCYLQKPSHFDKLTKMLELLELFWFNTSLLPPRVGNNIN